MKIKLLTLFVIAMLFASCNSHSGNSYTEIEANVNPLDSVGNTGRDEFISLDEDNFFWEDNNGAFDAPCQGIGHFRYHGHLYIIFSNGGRMAVVHDPDCPCNSQRTENQEEIK